MADKPNNPAPVAYLVSQYPALSHTFILSEVLGLRDCGLDVRTVSINADRRPSSRLTENERGERERTWYVKADGVRGALAAHARTLLSAPHAYLRGWRSALRAGGWDLRRGLWSAFHLSEALMIGQWMARQRIHNLHVHFATAAASVACLVREVFPVHLSMTVHGPDEFTDAQRERIADKVARADLVVCISHFARSQLMHHADPLHWRKLVVCRLGVDAQRFRAPEPSGEGRTRPFTLLNVGRHAPVKGQALLLDALAMLRDRGRDVRLQLVGDGPQSTALRSRCSAIGLGDRVEFLGALNQDELPTLYRQADAFMLPSFAEGIPIVLMEAMASGLPCIASRIAGIPELIEDGQSGLLIPPSDVEAMVDAIESLIDHPDFARRIAQAGTRAVAQHYALKRNIERLAEIFRPRMLGSPA